MSDLLKAVVEEALGRGTKAPARVNPLGPGASPQPGGFLRPNYQQENRHKRLNVPGGAAAAMPESSSPSGREFIENSLSPLLRLALVQGKTESAEGAPAAAEPSCGERGDRCAGMIGRSAGGVRCWYYPDLSPRLCPEFGLYPSPPVTLGIVSADASAPGQLFVLEEALKNETVKAEVTWSREGGPFEARLTAKEPDAVRRALDRLCAAFQRETGDGPRILVSPEPSAMLARQLGTGQDESVAVIEGLSRYRSVALLDLYMKKNPNPDFRYRMEPAYLVITGKKDSVSEAVRALRQAAEPYLSGRE
ncbi:hypothetical protein [Cohnella caldifontis]|uniref:hypothetical protein n=1 Tax=Cohnella caldifontis TaxID=3027471 RepID=UPI0023EC82CC|nr:hypothetical protein [Cohnella sp. YIM B05605]